MINGQYDLQLTCSEFIMLSMLLGAVKITGISDPENIAQMNEQQLSDKWNEIKINLQSKGYINEETEDTLQIDETVCMMIKRYICSGQYIRIQITEKGKDSADELLFISDSGTLNITFGSDDIMYVPIPEDNEDISAEQILKRYISDRDIEQQRDGGISSAVLKKSYYYEYMAHMNLRNITEAVNLLIKGGMDEPEAKEAADAYLNKNLFISITVTDVTEYESEFSSGILMFLFGESNIFSIKISEKDDEAFLIETINKQIFKNVVSALSRERTVKEND